MGKSVVDLILPWSVDQEMLIVGLSNLMLSHQIILSLSQIKVCLVISMQKLYCSSKMSQSVVARIHPFCVLIVVVREF